MLKNYLIVATRHLLRHKGYSAINILGLAVGMACCLLVGLFIQDEFQYDTFHKDGDRIYRILSNHRSQNSEENNIHTGTSGPLGLAISETYPQVESYMRVYMAYNTVWFHTDKHIGLEKYFLTDPHFFEFFSFPLKQGDKKTVLKEPFTAVITETMAQKYFGDQHPIGQTILIDTQAYQGTYRVTGVMKDPPVHSTLQMDFVTASYPSKGETHRVWNNWYEFEHWRPIHNYIKLKPGALAKELEAKLPDLALKHNQRGLTANRVKATNSQYTFYLQPLRRIHLYSNADYGITIPALATDDFRGLYGDIQRIYLLSAIALFILAIACVNFMNLTTARSTGRAREVGLRKAVGADRRGLIQQFLGESILVALLALILAIVFFILALPTFNGLIGKSLSLHNASTLWLVGLCSCAVLVGVGAGSYPAFFLSAFQPSAVLKGAFQSQGQGAWVRKVLVVLQFSISILLIISTVMIDRQLTYMQNKPLGFQKEHVVVMPIFSQQRRTVDHFRKRLIFRYETVIQTFLKHPNVEAATLSRGSTGQTPGFARVVKPQGSEQSVTLFTHSVDEKFIDFFGLELIAGRNFKPEEMFRHSKYYILNESAVKKFGWADPIGKQIDRNGNIGTVIGVVKDFHNHSLHNKIAPASLIPIHGLMSNLVLRIRSDRIPETIDFLQKTWTHFLPSRPFQFEFLDQTLDQAYRAEQRMAKSTGAFSLIAIGLACLGLFGLAAFTTEQRTKEIGVRKVLGASASHIVFILSKEFARLVLIANLISWPIAYYGLNEWLQTFAYRTALGAEVFVLGGGLAILIALLTVSTLAIRASLSNPVEALRYE